MKIAWATDFEGVGDEYGFSLGNRHARKALMAEGVEIDPEAKLVLHHCPPHAFKPRPGKTNILWTAWEFHELPDWETGTLDGADAVFVTGRFLVEVFERYVAVPVRYVPQGIDTESYWPDFRARAKRRMTRRPYRALWVGAPNDRKGWQFALGVWRAFEREPSWELYVKTTAVTVNVEMGNIRVDSRNLSTDELRAVYQSADLFLLPSMGEGFGFTMGEAMACGLPVIYTPCTALVDLAEPDYGIPVDYRTGEAFRLFSPDMKRSVMVQAAVPDVDDIALKMFWAHEHRTRADKIGCRAAAHIREKFTWAHSVRWLLEELKGVADLSPRVEV